MYDKCESIVILDGESPQDLINLIEQYDSLRVISQQHAGVAAARNNGIKNANGKWVVFVDADDQMEPNAIKNFISTAETMDADVVVSNHTRVYNRKKNKISFYKLSNQIISRENIISTILAPSSDQGAVWAKCFNKDFLISNNIFFNETLINGEDQDFLIQCALKNARFVTLNFYTYSYIYNSRSAVRSFNKQYADNCINTIICIKRHLDKFQSFKEDIFHDYCLDRLLLISINYIFHPSLNLSYDERIQIMKSIIAYPIFRDAINTSSFHSFPIIKRLFLYSIRRQFFYITALIAYTRHWQLNVTEFCDNRLGKRGI